MYNNLNTGVLEQYLEEKNLRDSFEISHWDTKKVLIGILIGAVFSGVTAYIGLKIDRKSTRLNSSHKPISYAVFCLKKKKRRRRRKRKKRN